ncbi:putative 2OG-Fe(II) oxygenase [Shewanella sp. OMA3-2]|uniref:putative 2OG-Fe(II) oxygenase n=1 Tax=Shewanella sp. OMA3-2 TaxID=2908650 RepID=UPI001F32E24C|nr:putative 2OG-Fe(II) oxygenase [Shewanella sp. OMA3-2]UJF23252.1 putative 2OG-Fe(II) oxygenase [Shewanella sp. OMA3-2]
MDKILSELSHCYRNGLFNEIIKLVEANPQLLRNIQVANLLAVSYRRIGAFESSKKCFESILVSSKHPGIYVSYAMLLSEMKQFQKACQLLEKAIELDPVYFDAFLNLGIVATEKGDYKKGLNSYKKALQIKPQHFGAYLGYIQSLMRVEDLNRALVLCMQAKFDAPYQLTFRLLAVTIKLKQFSLIEAEKDLLALMDTYPSRLDVKVLMVRLMLQKGDVLESIEILKEINTEAPYDIEVQTLLFECLMSSKAHHPFEFYELACQSQVNKPLLIDYFLKLMKLKYFDVAEQLIEVNAIEVKEDDTFSVLKAMVYREKHCFAKSLAQLEHIDINNALYASALYEKAVTLLCAKEYYQAYENVLEGIKLEPEVSRWQSLEYTCRKCLSLVSSIDLTTDIWIIDNLLTPELLNELKMFLLSLHKLKKDFIMQSIRDGSQTEGNLFHRDIPILNKVKAQFIEQLQINCKKRGVIHTGVINGAWSILMGENGKHVNHTHSEGTYSACFYVLIPKGCKEQGNGWFKCGGANISQTFIDEDDYYIEPIENRLVIFPSHLSHGTNSLVGTEKRLTLAFDYKVF